MLNVLLFCPLLGFLVLVLLPHQYKAISPLLSRIFLFVFFGLASFLLYENLVLSIDFVWVSFSEIKFGFFVSWNERLMLFLVSFIALLVGIFSEIYMQNDANKKRYFALLQLFVFAMLMLVVSANLLQTYIFWELVGFVSYLLIGFWQEKPEAVRASRKAFLTNRVGDVGFLIGIALIFAHTGELSFVELQNAISSGKISDTLLTAIGICVFLGAMAKSAQFPLHIWLPDAMAGPTPVSALLHAATMVAAGVFLSAKIIFLFNTDAKIFITTVAIFSVLLGAYKAVFERNIKKLLAYSTISQLGLMMLAIGAGSAETALFHLLTHAFFKAGLFLCVGAILDYLHKIEQNHCIHTDLQDMHLLGGLRKPMPLVFGVYTLCMFALAGLPFFSGFLSKEAIFTILWQKKQENFIYQFAFLTALFASFLTAFYIAKQWLLVFFGEFRLSGQLPQIRLEKAKISWQYTISLATLGLFTFGITFSLNPFRFEQNFWLNLANGSLQTPAFLPFVTTFLGILGLGLGFWEKTASVLTAVLAVDFLEKPFGAFLIRLLRSLSQNVYQAWQTNKKTLGVAFWLVSPVLWLSRLLSNFETFWSNFLDNLARTKVVLAHIIAWADKTFVDGFIHFLLFLGRNLGNLFRNLQGRNIQAYFSFVIFFLLLGLLACLFF